jgi:hypothetical protein
VIGGIDGQQVDASLRRIQQERYDWNHLDPVLVVQLLRKKSFVSAAQEAGPERPFAEVHRVPLPPLKSLGLAVLLH